MHGHDHHGHHHHHHHHHHGHNHSSIHNLKFAFFVNFGFALIQIMGGIWSQSSAVLAGAIHDLSDSLTLIVSYIMERTAHKKSNAQYSYGYKRLSLVSAFITCIIVSIASVGIISQAMPKLLAPIPPKVEGMVGFALLGILVNGVAALRLYKGKTLNEKVVSWHLVEDLLGWAAVLIGSILIELTGFSIIDPLLSIGLALFVLFGVAKSGLRVIKLFLQASPDGIDLKKLKEEIIKISGIKDIHDLHIWSLDGNSHVITLHVIVEDGLSSEDCIHIKHQVRKTISHQGEIHVTIEIESTKEQCGDLHCVGD